MLVVVVMVVVEIVCVELMFGGVVLVDMLVDL